MAEPTKDMDGSLHHALGTLSGQLASFTTMLSRLEDSMIKHQDMTGVLSNKISVVEKTLESYPKVLGQVHTLFIFRGWFLALMLAFSSLGGYTLYVINENMNLKATILEQRLDNKINDAVKLLDK